MDVVPAAQGRHRHPAEPVRTTVTQGALDWQQVVDHWLEGDETWADYGMMQPNPHWAHTLSSKGDCPACGRGTRP